MSAPTSEPLPVGSTFPLRRTLPAAIVALRPRQWMKNALLFAGIVFAGQTGDAVRWLEALAAFCAYCAMSSAAYLLNDVRDAEQDRQHPVKRSRPIARGELSPRAALALAGLLALPALALAASLGLRSLLFLAAFALLQAAYSLRLKRLVLVDVLGITGLFVIRAAAGAAAVHVHISAWLLACTGLLALFLGLAKRRGELTLVGAGLTPGRAVLGRYSLRMLDRLLWLTAAGAVVSYVLYTLAVQDSAEMLLSIPFVVAGIGRYLKLVYARNLGEEPEHVLLSDPVIIGCVAAWTLVAAAVLTSS
ncbi:MAG: UbiA prenyltransferase family protein [Gaiellaceae bacterium]